jgi:hypothetical protein
MIPKTIGGYAVTLTRDPVKKYWVAAGEMKRERFEARAAQLRARAAASADELAQAGEGAKAVLLQSLRRMFRQVLISPDSYGDPRYPWRATDLDGGEPLGHHVFRTKEQALRMHGGQSGEGPPYASAYEYYAVRSDRPAPVGEDALPSAAPRLDHLLGELARLVYPEYDLRFAQLPAPAWSQVEPGHLAALLARHRGDHSRAAILDTLRPFFERLAEEKLIAPDAFPAFAARTPVVETEELPGIPAMTPPKVRAEHIPVPVGPVMG